MSLKSLLELLEGSDDTLESSGNIREVGGTTTNNEDLALGVGFTSSHQIDNGLGVLVGLTLGRGTRVFTVVGELVSEPSSGDSIGVDDGGTTTSDHGPNSTSGVEDGKLERSTSRGIELLDVGLFLGQISTERSGPNHGWSSVSLDLGVTGRTGDVSGNGPLGSTEEVGSLVELGGHVEVEDLGGLAVGGVHADEGVDLEVGDWQLVDLCEVRDGRLTVKVDVDGVQSDEEIT